MLLFLVEIQCYDCMIFETIIFGVEIVETMVVSNNMCTHIDVNIIIITTGSVGHSNAMSLNCSGMYDSEKTVISKNKWDRTAGM